MKIKRSIHKDVLQIWLDHIKMLESLPNLTEEQQKLLHQSKMLYHKNALGQMAEATNLNLQPNWINHDH